MSNHPHLNCVDMSHWGGPLTAEEAACMKESGIRKIIVGSGHPGPGNSGEWARQQAASALAHGLEVDAYVYLYLASAPAAKILAAFGALRGLPIGRWWLNVEDVVSTWFTPAERERIVFGCLDVVEDSGKRAGIATARWWWVPNMGDSVRFDHLPLWNAWYDGDPDTDGLPYGGWTDSLIEQYQGTTTVCGQSVDLNYDKSLGDEDTMTDDEFAERMQKVGKERGWFDAEGPVDRRLRTVAGAREVLRKLAAETDAGMVQRAATGALTALAENTED